MANVQIDANLRYIGVPVPRLDASAKVTGRFRYMSDMMLPGALWAVLVRSPHPHARVLHIDFSQALAYDNIVAAFGPEDVPDIQYNTAFMAIDIPLSASRSVLADKRLLATVAQHVGDAVAVVVASTKRAAIEAARRVHIEWDILPSILDPEQALSSGHIVGNTAHPAEVEELFAQADLVVTDAVSIPALQHVCMETHGCAAHFDAASGRLTIWSNTQAPFLMRRLCAHILGLSTSRVRILKLDEGGGFGNKQEIYEEALAGWLALQLGRPVRLQLSRAEEFSATRSRHAIHLNVRVGLRQDGYLLASDTTALLDAGAYASHALTVLATLGATIRHTYPFALHRFHGTAVKTHTLPGGAYRGYGAPQGMFAFERVMDIAADRLHIDSLQLRLRNLPPACDATSEQSGFAHDLQKSAHIFGWQERARTSDPDGIVRANGIAIAAVPSGTFPARLEASVASVRWNEDGSATLFTGTCDSSTGSTTALAQIVAEELGIPVEVVDIHEGDTDLGVLDMGSYAQRTITIGGNAAYQAAKKAKEALFDAVSAEYGKKHEDLRVQQGIICDSTGWEINLSTFCRQYTARGGGLVATATYRPQAVTPGYSACFVRVAVDTQTGKVQIERCLLLADCGRVLNPLSATGQIIGGVIQGIEGTLIGLYFKDARGMGPHTIREQGLASSLDTVPITVLFSNTPHGNGPYGAKGLGELAIVPTGAAIANAVAQATGVAPDRLPLRPATMWLALQKEQAEMS